MWIHMWIQIFELCVRCRLVLQWQPHCSTVCKVASASLLQTNVALSPTSNAMSKLHGLCHQHCHPIKGLLSLLLTHHFPLMDVDCYWPAHRSSPWSVGLLLWLLTYSNHHSTSAIVSQMDFYMHSQVQSFCSMLVHGNTFDSYSTPFLLRVPLLLFQ